MFTAAVPDMSDVALPDELEELFREHHRLILPHGLQRDRAPARCRRRSPDRLPAIATARTPAGVQQASQQQEIRSKGVGAS